MAVQNNDKIIGFSLLRLIASFLVIVIHVSGPFVVKFDKIPNVNWNISNFFDSISRVSVPIFFMISGAFLLSKEIKLKNFLTKRLDKIITPFIFWSLFYSLFNRVVLNNESFDIFKLIRDVFYGSEYHLWFVYYLLGLYLIVPIVEKWVKSATKIDFYYFFIIWIFTIIMTLPKIGIYFPKIELRYFSGFLGYFILGYYLKNHGTISKPNAWIFFVIGCLITCIGTLYFTYKYQTFFEYFYNYDSVGVILSAIGLYALVTNLKVDNNYLNKIVTFVSDYSFGIFLIHPFVLTILRLLKFDHLTSNQIGLILLMSFFTFAISLFIAFLIKKITILNKIV